MKQKMVAVLVVLIAHLLVFSSAQAYPDRPIKLVVPSPAGGPPDQIARLLSDKIATVLGQPVIVENRTGGAGGIIGAKSVATAEPDGHTLFMGSTSSVLIAPLIYKNAGYTAATWCAELWVSRRRDASASRGRIPENGCRDRDGPCSLSRRRSGPDGPLGRRGATPLFHAGANPAACS